MDEAQKIRIIALAGTIRAAIDGAVDDDAVAWEVAMATVANAAAISKQIEIDDNEFFDMVVKVYELTCVEKVERH